MKNLQKFLPATGKIKALAFCATKGHAQFMAKEFIRHGLPAVCLLGESSENARSDAIRRLQDEDDPLQIICSVDILAEGVDIPAVSHVLMLRPTMSFTVFLQQLGRGLRQVPGKEYLVALDFVGNHRNSFVAPLVLRGTHRWIITSRRMEISWIFASQPAAPLTWTRRFSDIWDREIRGVLARAPEGIFEG